MTNESSPPAPPPDPDAGPQALHRALRAVGACGVALVVIALLWLGGRMAVSTALGAVVAVANLYALGHVVRSLLASGAQRAAWGVAALLKHALLFGGLWALVRGHHVEVLPLMLGYAALPLGITLTPLFAPPSGGPGADKPASPSSTTSLP